jgi:hypothetical protein
MAHKITKEQMLEAIQGSQGLVSKIQRKLEAILGEKISWDTTEKWIHKWEEAETAVKNEKEAMLDIAENNIFKDMVNGDTATSKWYLRMKGKERGYEDTPTLQLANEDPLRIDLTGDLMTAEELAASDEVEITGGDQQ